MSTSTQISMNQKKKSLKAIDLVSNLPDCVTSHILSRLSTREAARTSILSKDWKYKWTLKYNIELDDEILYGYNEVSEAHFPNFVDRTLHLSQNLQSFRLTCRKRHDLIRMQTWISTALSCSIRDLHICYNYGGIVLPCNLLNYCSLRKLDLNIVPCILKVPAEICFPHLTFLLLKGVEFVNELCSTDVVKLNFPILETFILINYKWLNVKFVELYAPKMTRFATMTAHDADVSDYAFKITGGSRFKFQTFGGLSKNIILSGGSEVVHLDLNGCCGEESLYHLEKGGMQIRTLMNEFLSLKELTLSDLVVKALAASKARLSFPQYYEMERLVMYYVSNTEVLLELLHAAPFLKYIRFVMSNLKDYEYDGEEYVPSCIVSHLEEVEFDGFTREIKLEKFILKNAIQLKTMHVCSKEIADELSTYPKASTCLTIVHL